jgi:hypothetical protein
MEEILYFPKSQGILKYQRAWSSPALFVLIGVVGVFSIVMIYHWFTYGRNKILSFGTLIVYLCGVLFLMGGIIDIFMKLAK